MPSATSARTVSHSSGSEELTVRARTPARAAASAWSRSRTGSGETATVGPLSRARQRGRHEAHRGLAPAGPLHHRRPAFARDECLDGPPPVLPQPGRAAGVADETGEHRIGGGLQAGAVGKVAGARACGGGVRGVWVGHAPMQPGGTDKARTLRPGLWTELSTGVSEIGRRVGK
ncbi:hypothetical protein GCM10018987_00950 [Streptomyces cremeus]